MRRALQLTVVILMLSGYITNGQPLTGVKNIPGDYATIAAAVTALNTHGVGDGGVTFNVAAGHTETLSARINLTATGTAANPIVFQKSGTGANPLITAYQGTSTPGSATPDGIWSLVGSDYVTIDGIDLYDPNTSNPATMEYGYGLFKASATNGCQYVTIRNCTITLNRVNNAGGSLPMPDGSTGILIINATPTAATTAITPTSAAGSNSFNTIRANTIQNANNGIVLMGFAATSGVGPNPNPSTFLGDLNNDIGGTAPAHGNTILNFGGASGALNPAAGIRANNQWSINISYNTINNNNGGGSNHPSTLRGIFAQAGTSANATISNNNITIKGGGTTSRVAAIENNIGATAAANTVSLNNNTITGDYLTATTGDFYGIYNTASAATVNINGNVVQNISYSASSLAGSGSVYPIWNSGAGTNININNNTVNNITRTGTTGGTTIGIYVTAGSNQTVTGNTISNMSIDGSGTSSMMYGILTSTGTIVVNNNTIFNLQCIKSTGSHALYGIYNNSSSTNETVNNNLVYNLTHNGTGPLYGIYHFTATGNRTMAGNLVYNLTGAGISVAGIVNTSSSPSVYNNKIYNIQSTSIGTPIVSGIIQGALGTAGSANIYNNFICEIKAPNANPTAQSPIVRGIEITTTTSNTNIYVYYNTVYLDASSSGTNFSSAAIYHVSSLTATTANLLMRNNIFVNNSTPSGIGLTVAYWRAGTSLANYNFSSNNNLFYAGTPSTNRLIFFDGTNSDQTIAAYKTRVAPRDANSFTENPPFVNVTNPPYDLHINPNVPTLIESGGIPISTPIAITTDYDGDSRNTTTPDVGADEGNFTVLDITPPVITYTPPGSGIVAPQRVFSNVVITDPSGVNTTSGTKPRVYFKKSTHANTFNDNTSSTDGWKYVEADNNNSPFSFTINYSLLYGGAGVIVGDVIQYFVVAQDLATTPNIGINSGIFNSTPSSVNLLAANFPITGTINSYNIVASISGTVTVGTGGDYPSLTGTGGLFADINSKLVSGNITALILSNLSETGTNALNQWVEEPSGSNFTLTIAPNDASAKTISGSYTGGLIRINGADRVIIDGRYEGSGNYLTVTNTATSETISAIQIISSGTGSGANNITIRNCNISTGHNGFTSYGIHAGGSSLGTAGDDNDNLTITENNIYKAYYGIFIRANASGVNNNLTITKNSIGSNTVADYIGKFGIDIAQASGASISENTIFNIKTSNNNLYGISIATGVTNATISRNLIYSINYTGTGGYGGKGIDINTGVANSNITIANNVIYDIGGDGWSSLADDANVGIRILGTTGGINIYYNSVHMYGTWNRTPTATLSAALYIPTGVYNIDVRNNILSNSIINASNTGSKAYAIYVAGTNAVFSNINYNNYFASGTQGILGFLSSNITTLTGWQTATGQDANSYNLNPNFTSSTNLQPTPGNYLGGIAITGITTDITGTTRGNPPAIGAYEGYLACVWSGGISADWNTSGNWNINTIPDNTRNVIVPAYITTQPQVNNSPSSPAICNNLTLLSGSSLTINAGKSLTVSGTLTNNGTLTIKSDATGTGSLIHHTSGVNATVERYIPAVPDWGSWLSGWHLLSSPVASQSITGAWTPSGTGDNYDFYAWSESMNMWLNQKDGTNNITTFEVGKGYLVAYQQTKTNMFAGHINVSNVTLNNLSRTTSSSYSGWHLLGNPFASPLQWNDGNWALSNVAGTAKIWHSTNQSYTDIAANGIIPAAQGFFVQVGSSSNSITIPAASRVHNAQSWYKSADVYALKLMARPADNSSAQEFNLRIEPGSTMGYDFYYDSRFLPGYAPHLYAITGDEKLSTCAIPALDESIEIPLGFRKTTGSTFVMEMVECTLPAVVYLIDLKTGITHNLTQNPVYSFTSTDGDALHRFNLSFGSVGIEPLEKPVPVVYTSGNVLYLRNFDPVVTVEIYSVAGHLVHRSRTQERELPLQLATGIYVVKVNDGNQWKVEKVFVR